MIKGVYTVSEMAKILKISEKTAYRLIQDQEIPHIRVRGQIRITAKALDNYLQGVIIIEGTTRNPVREK